MALRRVSLFLLAVGLSGMHTIHAQAWRVLDITPYFENVSKLTTEAVGKTWFDQNSKRVLLAQSATPFTSVIHTRDVECPDGSLIRGYGAKGAFELQKLAGIWYRTDTGEKVTSFVYTLFPYRGEEFMVRLEGRWCMTDWEEGRKLPLVGSITESTGWHIYRIYISSTDNNRKGIRDIHVSTSSAQDGSEPTLQISAWATSPPQLPLGTDPEGLGAQVVLEVPKEKSQQLTLIKKPTKPMP